MNRIKKFGRCTVPFAPIANFLVDELKRKKEKRDSISVSFVHKKDKLNDLKRTYFRLKPRRPQGGKLQRAPLLLPT